MYDKNIQDRWFAYDWEDRFRFFDTQGEAIVWATTQISLYFDDDTEEWEDDVTYIRVGCLTHQTISFPVQDQDYCSYKLMQIAAEN